MRANLTELAKVIRPVSEAESRALAVRCEAETVDDERFVDAEHEMREEFLARAEGIEHRLNQRRVAFG